ncbi:MAG: prenyltransferase/squalene oxidase repeat-containing protein [Rubrobacteraceae bacterium]
MRVDDPQPIQPTDYDTSWAARLTDPEGTLAYPRLVGYLMSRQHPDGSWGGRLPYVHDRLLTTLAVLLLIARVGNRQRDREQRVEGERYIWRHVNELHRDAYRTIGFEMILPTLLAEGKELGLNLPYDQLRHYEKERAEKLRLLPTRQFFETVTSALFSLEAFSGEAGLQRAPELLLENGSMATSPSATAFLLGCFTEWRSRYPESVAYLEDLLDQGRPGLPTVAPTDVFMRTWMIYNLQYGELLAGHTNALKAHCEYLQEHLGARGVGWASSGIPDSDDTAVALLVLKRTGYEADGRCLLAYERDQHFAVLDHERDPSVSANLHILEALETLPEKERPRVRDKILSYLLRVRYHGTFWQDKWHVSPYYPTSTALKILSSYVPEELDPTLRWLFSTQHTNGAWGIYMPTSEETALTLLSLLYYHRTIRPLDPAPLHRAAEYLLAAEHPFANDYPELWISKVLYAPSFAIKSSVLAALGLYNDTLG